MSRIAAIGPQTRIAGYAMAGVQVLVAEDAEGAHAAWDGLGGDVACLLMTSSAHAAVQERLAERPDLIWAVIPDVE